MRRVLAGAAAGAAVLAVAAVAVAQIISGVRTPTRAAGVPRTWWPTASRWSAWSMATTRSRTRRASSRATGISTTRRSRLTSSRPRPSPTRTPTWSPVAARVADGGLRLRPSIPHPGPRGLHAFGRHVQPRLLHARQPRRQGPAAPRDAAQPAAGRRDRQRRALHRRLDVRPVHGPAALHGGGRQLGGVFGQALKWTSTTAPPVTSYDGSMGKAGYEGIAQRQARQPDPRRGRRGRQRHPERRQAAQLVRLPLRAGARRRSDQGQAPGPADLGQRRAGGLPQHGDRRRRRGPG